MSPVFSPCRPTQTNALDELDEQGWVSSGLDLGKLNFHLCREVSVSLN